MAGNDYLAVIAIDFGTTFSGYAFSMKTNKNAIIMNKNWGAEAGFQGYKTPTTLLLGPDGSLKSFGFQAENDFTNFEQKEIQKGYTLFQRFKMELYAHEKLTSDVEIKSTTGKRKRAVDIIAMALTYMKDHSLKAISASLESGINEDYIRWVITVPAIWSDTAKKFMRLAAKEAGLVDDILSQNLIIALEPEAASLYCRTLALNQFIGMDGMQGDVSMDTGEKYIVVDCGGGTIDITVHEVLDDGKVQEVDGASGGPWGGIYVDRKYYSLLDDIFGSNFMNILKRDHPATWLSMVVEFETKKRSAKPGGSGINMLITLDLASTFEKHQKESLIKRIGKRENLGVKYSNGMLRIPNQVIQNMYSEVLPEIGGHLRELLGNFEDDEISKMFVVGGFGESAYVQEFLTSEFGDDMSILIPGEAGMCIMKGAVLFGHDETIITSRIARFNYSVSICTDFDPDEHDPSRMEEINGEEKIFLLHRYIEKGQRIDIDDVVTHTFQPSDPNGDEVGIDLYQTEDDDTDDPEDPDAQLLESIVLSSPNTDIEDREIEVSLRFGGTDIMLYAIDVESGNEAEATVTF